MRCWFSHVLCFALQDASGQHPCRPSGPLFEGRSYTMFAKNRKETARARWFDLIHWDGTRRARTAKIMSRFSLQFLEFPFIFYDLMASFCNFNVCSDPQDRYLPSTTCTICTMETKRQRSNIGTKQECTPPALRQPGRAGEGLGLRCRICEMT